MNDRKRKFSFEHVVSARFSDFVTCDIIEDVILNLETHTYKHSELFHSVNVVRIVSRSHRSRLGTRRKEDSRFLFDDIEIILFRDFFKADVVELEKFSINQSARSPENLFHQINSLCGDGRDKGIGEHIITCQHRNSTSEQAIDRRLPTSCVALIDNIVVDQCSVMEKLVSSSQVIGDFLDVTKKFRRKNGDEWTHSFSSVLRHIGEDGVE